MLSMELCNTRATSELRMIHVLCYDVKLCFKCMWNKLIHFDSIRLQFHIVLKGVWPGVFI